MKRKMNIHRIVMAVMLLFCMGVLAVTSSAKVVNTEQESVKSTKEANNVLHKSENEGFFTKNGNTYYKEKGKKVKGKFLTVNQRTYYFNKKGIMQKGWMKHKGNYYFFHRKNGKMSISSKIDGIPVNKKGAAKNTGANIKKIKTMIIARKQMLNLCSNNDSKREKLRKCFDWVAKMPYRRYRFLKPIYKNKGWEVTFANDIFEKGDGCCVSEACALAFLVHECGYKKVYVAHDSEHAWMELKGKVYDTLFARSKNYEKYYGLSYKNYNCHAVDKVKI